MQVPDCIETERLRLRRWRADDLDALARLCADPEVMRYFPAPMTREESAAALARIEHRFETQGIGFWCAQTRDEGRFIGFVGTQVIPYEAAFTPAVEVGWRLLPDAWGKGYATEAARASMRDTFERIGPAQIVAVTPIPNLPSQAVMRRLGMQRDPADDFDHPLVEDGHPLQRHVLFRMDREAFEAHCGPQLAEVTTT